MYCVDVGHYPDTAKAEPRLTLKQKGEWKFFQFLGAGAFSFTCLTSIFAKQCGYLHR